MQDPEERMHVVPVLGDDEQSGNLLQQLAERRRLVAETRETLIPVSGYDKEPPILLVQYRLLDGPELDRIGQAVRAEFRNRWERSLHASVDLFVAAVTGLYVDEKGDGRTKPLTIGGQPVLGFTRELAEAMQFAHDIPDPDRPRDVVFGLFANNDVAISQHNFVLNRWMGDTSLDVSRELLEGNL